MDHIYRVRQDGEPFYAVENDGELRRAMVSKGSLFAGYSAGDPIRGGLGAVQVLAPVVPSKILCVGLNYKAHAKEQGKALPADPLLFIKPPTTVLDPGGTIRLPPGVGRVDYEGELAVVIGRRAHRVARADALGYIFGVTCLNDITARDLQNKEPQYTRCKGFDTFAPIGPCIATGFDGRPRGIETWVNGERRQASTSGDMIFGIDFLIEYITFVMTLEPGDVLTTGTPSGVGSIKHGDVLTVKVEGVGELTNTVEDE